MFLEDLQREISGKHFRPIYLFIGPEVYLRRRAVALLKEESLTPEAYPFNYAEFTSAAGLSQVLQVARTFPMMSPRRVVLLTDVAALTDTDQEAPRVYLGDPQERTVLILIAEDLDRRTKFFRILNENTCVVEFPKLKGYALERWAEDTIRRRGYRISSGGLKRLADQGGADLQTLANEIDKLLLYCANEKTIPDSAIDQLIGRSRHCSIFELIDALGRRDRPAALRILGSLLESGERPSGIAAMMARHFRQVLIAKELQELRRDPREIGASAQIPPFLLTDFLRQARAMNRTTAESMYLRLAVADQRFKSSGVDERMLLEKMICAF